MKSRRNRPLSERVLSLCRQQEDGCWIWTGHVTRNGYGSIGVTFNRGRARYIGAHRASWMAFRGEIAAGLCVCHHCDVPLCVNPDHLFLGTLKDNTRDMIAKGRAKLISIVGDSNGRAPALLCKRGHPLSGDNYVRNGHAHMCRACAQLRYLRARQKSAQAA